ncbi:MAG: ShlB/FhaC/HecB family hemolysin secretion/activation protein [Halarcobacter sp.]
MKLLNKLITISFLSSSLLFAVNVPNAGTISKDLQLPKNIKKNEKGLIEVNGVKKIIPPMKDNKSGRKVLVNDFNIQGNTKILEAELLDLIKQYKNKKLSFYDMQEVAHIITKLYRTKGYFLARAYIPVQDMKDGILKIIVIEGEFGKFNLENKSRVKDSIIQNIFDEAKKDTVISTSALERSMLIANDLSGVFVSKADVKAGSEVGSSDFDIETSPLSNYNGYIIADNYGSRYTGHNRVMGGLTVNSPFKIGDKLSFVGLLSEDSDLKYIDSSYETILHPNGLKGGIAYSYTGYELSEEFEELNARGYLKDINVNLSYPIIRQRDKNLYVRFDFDNKDIKDEIRSTDTSSKKEINVGRLSLDYTDSSVVNYISTETSLSVSLTYGNLTFKNDSDLADDKAGADTNGTYKKFNLEAFKSIGITPRLSLEGTFKYQHSFSNKNLDGSEDLSIGGSQGVKVYPTSEVSAENGYIATVEAKYLIPTFNNYSHSVGIFYDRARAYMANNTNVDLEDRNLQDVGVSYYASYKEFFLNSYMAWKVNSKDITSEPNYGSKLLVQVGWIF